MKSVSDLILTRLKLMFQGILNLADTDYEVLIENITGTMRFQSLVRQVTRFSTLITVVYFRPYGPGVRQHYGHQTVLFCEQDSISWFLLYFGRFWLCYACCFSYVYFTSSTCPFPLPFFYFFSFLLHTLSGPNPSCPIRCCSKLNIIIQWTRFLTPCHLFFFCHRFLLSFFNCCFHLLFTCSFSFTLFATSRGGQVYQHPIMTQNPRCIAVFLIL